MRRNIVNCTLCLLPIALMLPLAAQSPPESTFQFSCRPVSERTAEAGCWVLTSHPLGELPTEPIYWSLDVFPGRSAAEAVRTPRGTVVESLGKVWLLTIDKRSALPSSGQRVTQIGPLPIKSGEAYTAQFMEAVLPPGAIARTHRHPGPEAFYTESGETCLETPEGKVIGKKGTDIIIPEGKPMSLSVSGSETRRSLVLVLHSSSHPAIIVAEDWKPKGLCRSHAVPADEDISKVQNNILALHEEWNRHDMAGYTGHMTDDVQWVNVIGDWWKGKAQVFATLDRYHKTIFKDRQLHPAEKLAVRRIAPDVIVSTMINPADAYTNSAGVKQPATRNVLTLVWVKRDGVWLIAQAQNTIEAQSGPPKQN